MPGDLPQRRDRILSAAALEFAQHGFAGARIDRIAAAAGVNKQLLFHYFGSKDGLHKAAVESVLERVDVATERGRPPADGLRQVLRQLLAATEKHPELLLMLAAPASYAHASPDAIALATDWRRRTSESAEQVLQDAQRAGFVRDDVDPGFVAEVVVAASLGWVAASGREGQPASAGRSDQFGERLLKLILDYCAWR